MDKPFRWDDEKNQALKQRYGVGFEDLLLALVEDRFLADEPHHNQRDYAHQRELFVEIDKYAFVAAYVPDEKHLFLKTFHPCRNATKKYLKD